MIMQFEIHLILLLEMITGNMVNNALGREKFTN